MQIIKRRERTESVSYHRSFEWADMPGAGFGFDCDEHGNVDTDKLHPSARANYAACLTGTVERWEGVEWVPGKEDGYDPVPGTGHKVARQIRDAGVRKFTRHYTEPAIGKCTCGAEVSLSAFTNTCDQCGADYSMSGQRLAPREFWGEETGESVTDILRADCEDPFKE